jgi:hypothetical protein|tara:strand:- start:366 stop:560 length:195 start_codon:yes stop_codon:yes gene_type:complete
MTTINIIAIYVFCGILFGAGFEWLMAKFETEGREDTTNWQRLFWITAWPYCLIKFFMGYFGKDD